MIISNVIKKFLINICELAIKMATTIPVAMIICVPFSITLPILSSSFRPHAQLIIDKNQHVNLLY